MPEDSPSTLKNLPLQPVIFSCLRTAAPTSAGLVAGHAPFWPPVATARLARQSPVLEMHSATYRCGDKPRSLSRARAVWSAQGRTGRWRVTGVTVSFTRVSVSQRLWDCKNRAMGTRHYAVCALFEIPSNLMLSKIGAQDLPVDHDAMGRLLCRPRTDG